MEINAETRKNEKFEKMRGKMKVDLPRFSSKQRRSSIQTNHYSPQKSSYTQNIVSPLPENWMIQQTVSPFLLVEQFYLKNKFEQKYQTLQKLGQGANGIVKKCKDKITNEVFAVKVGKMEQEHVVALKRIVQMMRKINHNNILKMRQLYVDSERSKYYQILDYLPHPSLKHLISNGYKFISTNISKIMKQLLEALEYFHSHHIVHRDIKTSNLLYDTQSERLYVIDLGIITKTVQRGKRRNLWTNTGTLQYKAPQTLQGSTYNQGVDVWAAGVVLYELVQGKTPFKQQTCIDIIENIRQIKYKFTPQLWVDMPLAKLLVTRLLKNKGQRLSASAALKDPWFQMMDFQYKPPKQESTIKKNNIFSSTEIALPFHKFFLSGKNEQKNKIGDEDGQTILGSSQSSKFLLSASSHQNHIKTHTKITITVQDLQKMLSNDINKDIINNNN